MRSSVAGHAIGWTLGDFGTGRDGLVGVTVAGETIAHAHEHFPGDFFHGLNLPVAGLAGDSGSDVRPMIEVDVIGQGMDSIPIDDLIGLECSSQLLNARLLGASHRMAVHAGLGCGNPGMA